MNYGELKQAIQDYLETSETTLVANIPNFVRAAEQRIVRTIQIPELRKNATNALVSGTEYIKRPEDFIAVYSMSVAGADGQYSFLIDKDVNFIRSAYPSASTTGTPRYYAQFDGSRGSDKGTFMFGPTPDFDYTIELHYYYDPPSIVGSDTNTSWLGDNAETALLNGSLVEAYTFLKGDGDMLQQYRAQYDDAVAMLGIVQTRSQRDAYRDGKL
jgi:hypothetical protein